MTYTGKIKKIRLILLILITLLIGGWFFAKTKLADWMAASTQTLLGSIDPSYATIQTQIESNTCRWMPCITAHNTTLNAFHLPIAAGDIQIALRPTLPLSFHIKTLDSAPPPALIIEATTYGAQVDIRGASLKIGNFNATLNGEVDTKTGRVKTALSTVNLANFALPLMPPNLQFLGQLFLSNAPQTIAVYDENGWVTLQGLPLFPIK